MKQSLTVTSLVASLILVACTQFQVQDPSGPLPPDSDPPPPPAPAPPPAPPPPPPAPTGELSAAFGLWHPSSGDTCTKELHDSYSVVGPDGKLYPTWHPPVDPSGCTFGHEHGKDPRGSDLYAEVGDIPFGLANEALLEFPDRMPRAEDHFGHKIEWANGLEFVPSKAGSVGRRCDVLVKLHQGTHSADAFTNNVHELAYHLRCDDGAVMHFTMLAPLGTGGSFMEICTSQVIQVGVPNPPDSPGGVDTRQLPTRHCAVRAVSGQRPQGVQYVKAFGEVWPVSVSVTREDGSRVALVALYANIGNSSRYFDADLPSNLARSVDICYETDEPGDGRTLAECKQVRAFLPDTLHQHDPRSPFNGASRSVRWNQIALYNSGKPEVYYTDPFGRNGRTSPFPGSVRQYFSAMANDGINVYAPVSQGGNYSAPGVHAPN